MIKKIELLGAVFDGRDKGRDKGFLGSRRRNVGVESKDRDEGIGGGRDKGTKDRDDSSTSRLDPHIFFVFPLSFPLTRPSNSSRVWRFFGGSRKMKKSLFGRRRKETKESTKESTKETHFQRERMEDGRKGEGCGEGAGPPPRGGRR